MTRRGILVAILVGALLGVLVLAGALVALQRASTGEPVIGRRSEQGVLLALVLPDSNGNQAARLLVYYPPGGGTGTVIDPLTRAVVPGTSATNMGDAFTFGGGSALAKAYAEVSGVDNPAWAAVDEATWAAIAKSGLSVQLPRPIDVFNGSELVSFPAGAVALDAGDLGVLLAGIHGLDPSARRAVLGDAAAALQRALTSSGLSTGIESDLSSARLKNWLSSLASRSYPQTSTPVP
jgi:hypothetical protein